MTIGVARRASPAMKGFDALELLPIEVLKAFRAQGFEWIAPYLERMTAAYVQECFDADLAIHPVALARTSVLNAALGDLAAEQMVAHARTLECPESVHLVVDFEATHGSAADSLAYVNHAADGIVAAAYACELYVAPPQPLTGPQLYSPKNVTSYWHGGGIAPEIECGYAVVQGLPLDHVFPWASGHAVDPDIIFADRRGRTPVLWWRE